MDWHAIFFAFGLTLSAPAEGVMVFISMDESLPVIREYGNTHLSLYGLISGIDIMAIRLLLFV